MKEQDADLLFPIYRFLPCGGETVSTGVKTRGMHAERHRLVNPVEHNVTANTQLALAA